MGLDWCKLIDEESGWVSDNLLAFSRIIKWYYHPVTTLDAGKPFQELNTPVSKWLLPQCKEWIRAHGYEHDAKVGNLRTYITELKKNTTNPPTLIHNKSCTVFDIESCIGSLISMVASIMSSRVCINKTPDDMEREVKIFLTNIHNVDFAMNNKKGKDYTPYWLSKYNFQSLLNLPSQMKAYGPLVNLWEGGNKGEGYLRFAKPIITNIHSKNWQINAHVKLFSERSLESVLNFHIMNNSKKLIHDKYIEYVKSKNERNKKMYVTYDCLSSIHTALQRNRPVSCVRTINDCFYVVVRNMYSKKVEGFPISFQYQKSIDSLSMVYHTIIIDMSKKEDELCNIDTTSISNYVLLLPELGEFGYTNIDNMSLYYIIDSEWKELDRHLKFVSPKSPGTSY